MVTAITTSILAMLHRGYGMMGSCFQKIQEMFFQTLCESLSTLLLFHLKPQISEFFECKESESEEDVCSLLQFLFYMVINYIQTID